MIRLLPIVFVALHLGACGGNGESSAGMDGGSYGDVDADGDGDADADGDSDADTDPVECDLGEYIGDFPVYPQWEVDDFGALAGYTSVSGDLLIYCPSCTDLSELSCLSSVGGNLDIWENDALTNLDGLGSLTSVGGHLSIDDNTPLTNLDGLNALTSIGAGEELIVRENTALPDCAVCDLLDQLDNEPSLIDVDRNLDDGCTPVPDDCPESDAGTVK